MLNMTKERMETIIWNLLSAVEYAIADGDKDYFIQYLKNEIICSDEEIKEICNWFYEGVNE